MFDLNVLFLFSFKSIPLMKIQISTFFFSFLGGWVVPWEANDTKNKAKEIRIHFQKNFFYKNIGVK